MRSKFYYYVFAVAVLFPSLIFGQFTQMGSKIVGAGSDANSFQGSSVAISSDGNTAVYGGIYDNGIGAIWIYSRNGSAWTQQGAKLTGTGSVGAVYQGYSVAISADGNTVIEGGWRDNSDIGAAWIFTRDGGVWAQQGSKLVGSDAVGSPVYQGASVALSADGNTAFVGGTADNGTGAVWVFTRSNGIWTQQGSKLVATGGIGQTSLGSSLAVSSDGNTLVSGGISDNGAVGAVWVFTRNGSNWVQQGTKLVGSDGSDASQQGYSVGISADGNTVISGGPGDFLNEGAAWVFVRSSGIWSQQGPIIYPEISTSPINAGKSVAITPDGNNAVISGPGDNGSNGIVWVYTRSAGEWTKLSSTLIGTGAVGPARQGWAVAISPDGTVIEGGPYDNGGAGAVWFFHNPTLSIAQIHGKITNLEQNYPNPFNQITKISFNLIKSSFTKVTIYDLMGQEISTMVNEFLEPGTHEVDFDGRKMTTGTYFYKLETGGVVEMKKMILIR